MRPVEAKGSAIKGRKKTLEEAWQLLERSIITYRGNPIGTLAAADAARPALNYDQVFTRDFAVSAIAFLMRGEQEIVRNFLEALVEMQQRERSMDCFRPGRGVMPASFVVKGGRGGEQLVPDFGERAIARVAPVDSGLWWLYILRGYVRSTGDWSLAHRTDFQKAMKLILELCLTTRFDMYRTLLAPDGAYMIDRRMGVYGYPLDIQVLFFTALCAIRELLRPDDEYLGIISERLGHLAYHLQRYYWLDYRRLNDIYRYKVEGYGEQVINTFNIYPETIPEWLMEWLPDDGGYYAGNLGPARMDFRYFAQGNLMAIISGLATADQAVAIFALIEARWADLIGEMPAKLCFPALRGRDWKTVTGADRKNSAWSYHNGGNWPCLLWLLIGAAMKADRTDIAQRALAIAERRLVETEWAEYFDGQRGRLVGKEARRFQTWTIAGYAAGCELMAKPGHAALLGFDTETTVIACAESAGPGRI